MDKTNIFNCRAWRFFATALLLFSVSISANAHDFSAKNDDRVTIYYNIISSSDLTCEVTYSGTTYNSYSGTVVIPETVTYNETTYAVTSIGDNAFYGCTSLTEVTIPESVTKIGSSAFYRCTSLAEVAIPECVTEISDHAFRYCTGLTEVNVNAIACTSAGSSSSKRAFSDCDSISMVNFGDNVTIIPAYLCYGLTELTKETIPNSVTTIGEHAFYQCTGLTEVTIPESVTEIGQYAFSGCSGLTGTLTIPNSVISIGKQAFSGCTDLTSVTIPNSLISIGERAFSGCI